MGTVLLLEDDPRLQLLLTGLLENAGHEVLRADSADTALLAGERTALDLLVADVNTPGASGPVVAQLLREPYPELKVLFISGHDRVYLRAHGISPTADFLQKPFTPEQFRAALARAVGPADR